MARLIMAGILLLICAPGMAKLPTVTHLVCSAEGWSAEYTAGLRLYAPKQKRARVLLAHRLAKPKHEACPLQVKTWRSTRVGSVHDLRNSRAVSNRLHLS